MIRTSEKFAFLSFLLAAACSEGNRPPRELADCSAADGYEFRNISDFSGSQSGWFRYADPTPNSIPDPDKLQIEDPMAPDEGSNVPVTALEPPGRCGDTRIMVLEAEGHNFWGAGFGDWEHNETASRADGTGYEGISFWARSPINAEKSFILNVDDSRTIILPPNAPEINEDLPPPEGEPPCVRERGLPQATPADQDLDGDGCVGPGDIARATECRLPPSQELGNPACYDGGIDAPSSAGTRVPAPDECGNAFHTIINTTETWQLFLIPFNQLLQWPCPNRLDGGINPADIAKFEIRLVQGTRYEIWLDNISFYRRR